ncbi:hypothetical protein Poli38472_014295 [Pythium oligandrum]|uniref:Elicitin-like protein n=1 Tax=Pythium oligandrum TaxID=41045 RepID=A0A8K1CKS5_PYTOL|nr:hypothetical protein Poli38472_014295 [Pythium oligandrum]|eukprot:TMW64178.1 hypothetical protein Poli38472_014295 [Pythium oligandrum]
MKTAATFASIAALSAAIVVGAPCNFEEIKGKLFSNATEGLQKCATTTGFDIWSISAFPTEDHADKIMTTRDCVDFLNQINQRANQEIQCDVNIAGVTKDFGAFLVDVLTGKTGNGTESMENSGSDDIEVPKEASSSKESSTIEDQSASADGAATSSNVTTTTPSPSSATSLWACMALGSALLVSASLV